MKGLTMSATESEMTSNDAIVHTRSFDAPVAKVFSVIAESGPHSEMTGAPADLATERGGTFTTHGGGIEGVLLDRAENEYIVQAWRPADWAAGVYSVVRYDFAEDGAGTEITLTHSAIPEGASVHLADGWNTMYWGPLTAHLAS